MEALELNENEQKKIAIDKYMNLLRMRNTGRKNLIFRKGLQK